MTIDKLKAKAPDLADEVSENPKKITNKRWLLIILVAVFFIMAVIGGGVFAFEKKYQDRVLPNIQIGDIGLNGLTKEQAQSALNQIADHISQTGLKLIYRHGDAAELKLISLTGANDNPDLSQEIVRFDNEKTAGEALAIGRQNFFSQLGLLFKKKSLTANFSLDDIALENLLREQFADWETASQNAAPKITWQGKNYEIEITPENDGLTFDYLKIIQAAKNNFQDLKNEPLEIRQMADPATIALSEAEANKNLINGILATTSPKFIFENKEWVMSKKDLANLLEFQRADSAIKVGINYETFDKWLEKNIGPEVNIRAQDAKIEMTDGQITKIIPHQNGQKIDLEKIYQNLNDGLLADSRVYEILVQKSEPAITISGVNNLGIKEIIGGGRSNFKGSPANRRHNIATGAGKLNGIIIKPDEEFSLINALGPVDATTGYLPELVIKENKTTPEFGGGLCQIGTTTFRAAMGSGLPITERRAHSYSVTYYLENGLPGVDATIYIPHPDVRFLNDTGNYILIQTRIAGNDLIFEFWGTKDGRVAEHTKPKVWNWVSPPPTKTVETTDLPVGQKKCTETSHRGVDASFDYLVTYANGEIKKQTFTSHYKPWQAVCLIGVEKLPDTGATSTAESIPVENNAGNATAVTNP